MPKKIFAVTNIKVNSEPGGSVTAGDEVDPTKFTKDELRELHDAGAIEVKTVDADGEPEPEAEPVLTGAGTPVPATDVDLSIKAVESGLVGAGPEESSNAEQEPAEDKPSE